MPDLPFQILLYYHYASIADPEAYVDEHLALCEGLGLRGRILVAKEGINGTVSGEIPATQAYMDFLHSDSRFEDMAFKVDPSDGHAFPKLSVKARSEVVTLGLGDADIDPNEITGEKLDPGSWLEMLEAPDGEKETVILDGRNLYEAELGRFRGAICPDIENFRDFPQWFEEHRSEFEGKRVMTYCTGGIRCEKLSGYLRSEGVEDVYQLDGGIIRYGHDEETKGKLFDGRCYVFDQRIGVDVNRTETNCVISRCEVCGGLSDRYVNCSLMSCNRQHFRCEECEEREGRICSPECVQKSE